MPSGGNPILSHNQSDFIIQFQGFYGCPSAHGSPDDACAVIAPEKVAKPFLLSRIEEFYSSLS